jgi:cell wall-associated NlpC family hydrolase
LSTSRSTTSLRYGGAALASVLSLSGAVTAAANAAPADTADRPTPVAERRAEPVAVERPAAPTAARGAITTSDPRTGIRQAAIAALPKLSLLDLPELGGTLASTGYAARDVVVDLAPDLADRDLGFVLQSFDGTTWTDVATGTTTGSMERSTLASVPAGTYRVVVPAQLGLQPFTSTALTHAPRQLAAGASFDKGAVATTVDVNPDPAAGATYTFLLQKWDGAAWADVAQQATTTATGTFTFSDLASGRYRATVPDQADAVGTVSNELDVLSKADIEAAAAKAEAAERARAAAERAALARQTRSQAATTQGSRAAAAAPTEAPPPANAGGVVGTGLAQVGKAYRLGATGPSAFDCSGLTSYAYRAAGKSIPRTASSQYAAAAKVSDPAPGDLVFFLRNGAQHVGIYIGGGRMVHAANPGRGVEVTSFSSGWYARSFTGYGRF